MVKELKRFKNKNEYIIFYKHGTNDFAFWLTDDCTDELSGCSVRGTKTDIINELDGMIAENILRGILI
ncbi:hypothetical protein HZI73_26055 (plasmid) [Vallitalea pronyensis]|uniref:Uncharacterized protein n=1 Tax=Vallitalea pronyensis TaxID=1348613 RepID=A0A8J8MQQ1_9FIRM|nr:hypothetical protein [Vallitalea pronyensis]QUI25879.1 hypothetical protein HZI73_26055 [Vallitalea pronyensis]